MSSRVNTVRLVDFFGGYASQEPESWSVNFSAPPTNEASMLDSSRPSPEDLTFRIERKSRVVIEG